MATPIDCDEDARKPPPLVPGVPAAARPAPGTTTKGERMPVHIPDEYLMCRDLMHAWDADTATVGRNKPRRRREVRQTLRCTRCHTVKTRIMTTTGELIRNSYAYPPGYQLTEGRLSPADRGFIRVRNWERSFTTEEVA